MATRRASKPAAGGPRRCVALLRGINVGGKRLLPMAELRAVATALGFGDIATYIQSGNLLFTASSDTEASARAIERGIAAKFGFEVPVVVRPLAEVVADLALCPFPDALGSRPNLLHVGYSGAPFPKTLAQALAPYCQAGERVVVRGAALWIDFVGGVARAKITSAVLDRLVGSPVTLRNAKSMQAIAALAGSSASD